MFDLTLKLYKRPRAFVWRNEPLSSFKLFTKRNEGIYWFFENAAGLMYTVGKVSRLSPT